MKLNARDELYYDFISFIAFDKVDRILFKFFYTVLVVVSDFGAVSDLFGFDIL